MKNALICSAILIAGIFYFAEGCYIPDAISDGHGGVLQPTTKPQGL